MPANLQRSNTSSPRPRKKRMICIRFIFLSFEHTFIAQVYGLIYRGFLYAFLPYLQITDGGGVPGLYINKINATFDSAKVDRNYIGVGTILSRKYFFSVKSNDADLQNLLNRCPDTKFFCALL
jgi:hypothetical protein